MSAADLKRGTELLKRAGIDEPQREARILLAGAMNFGGNIVGVIVPILIGLIVQFTGTYFLALMFFVVAAFGLAVCASLIDYRDRGLD